MAGTSPAAQARSRAYIRRIGSDPQFVEALIATGNAFVATERIIDQWARDAIRQGRIELLPDLEKQRYDAAVNAIAQLPARLGSFDARLVDEFVTKHVKARITVVY